MIPIRDTLPSSKYPVINTAIIGVNVFVFFFQSMYPDPGLFIHTFGMIPARYTDTNLLNTIPAGFNFFTLFSYMFLHGGFWHLLFNMWSLYIFGDNIEDQLGHLRYIVFYLLCGFASGCCHLAFNLHSRVPVIGASGAIAGVMGAYFILYPRSRILTLIPIFFIPWFIEIPAFIFLGIWFFMQIFHASSGGASGIAWFAHIGGFLGGILLLKIMPEIKGNNLFVFLNEAVGKTRSPKFQTVNTAGAGPTPDLFGTIFITSGEAASGTYKIINIPWGHFNKLYKVKVPGGIIPGKRLRLRGLGTTNKRGQTGDLYLRIIIK